MAMQWRYISEAGDWRFVEIVKIPEIGDTLEKLETPRDW